MAIELKPTMADVARIAGVSKATVSKALARVGGRYQVSAAMRARVAAAAAQAGFGRAAAAGTRRGRIALLFGGETPLLDGTNLRQHLALITAMLERRLEVVYQSMDRDSRDGRARAVARTDGCLLIAHLPYTRQAWRRWLDEIAGFPPCVAINPGLDLPIPVAAPDDAAGTAALIADLAARGHRCIALSGPLHRPMQHGSMHIRHRTALATAAAAGVAIADWCDQPPATVVDRLRASPATALVLLSGWRLPALWSSLVRAGIDVPRDLALATCDDPQTNQQLDPGITGLTWSMDELVAAALSALDGAGRQAPRLVPVTIAHRASTAGPAAKTLGRAARPGSLRR